jgi:hypothetical protein
MVAERVYRLFQIKNNKPLTLFHGVDGSRTLPLSTWVTASQKLVSDGGQEYVGGFHCMRNFKKLQQYLERFDLSRREIVIAEVFVDNPIWIKPTNKDIILCAKMYIPPNFRDIGNATPPPIQIAA